MFKFIILSKNTKLLYYHSFIAPMQKRAVIIGGGFAGSTAARKLEDNFNVTLIDTKDYFEFTPSVLRTIVEPEHIKKIQSLHRNYLSKAVVVRGYVKEMSKKYVMVSGKKFLYDYLTICSGSEYNLPMKSKSTVTATRADVLAKYAKKLKESNSALIIGGGLVGVELAAEIIEKYPEKKVTIAHGINELIERNPQKAMEYSKKFLKKRKVKLILNEFVVKNKGNVYITDKKTKIKADLAFLCTGIKPNYQCMSKSLSHCLNEKKAVIVNEYLQVKGFQNVFAAGDINDVNEEKTAQNAEKQAEVVVKNIVKLEKGKALKKYLPKPRIMVISLGKWNGILVYKSFVLTGLIPGILKTLIEWKEMRKYKNKY